MMDDKKEIKVEEMEKVSGGGNNNQYDNDNGGGKQMSNQGENNKIDNSGTIDFGN